jgi:hypothetical protein
MTAEQLIGTWGSDHGYCHNPDEARLTFEHGGVGHLSQGKADCMPFRWRLGSAGLELCFKDDHWYGPYKVHMERRNLPMGQFTTLSSSGALLPFGHKNFQRVENA